MPARHRASLSPTVALSAAVLASLAGHALADAPTPLTFRWVSPTAAPGSSPLPIGAAQYLEVAVVPPDAPGGPQWGGAEFGPTAGDSLWFDLTPVGSTLARVTPGAGAALNKVRAISGFTQLLGGPLSLGSGLTVGDPGGTVLPQFDIGETGGPAAGVNASQFTNVFAGILGVRSGSSLTVGGAGLQIGQTGVGGPFASLFQLDAGATAQVSGFRLIRGGASVLGTLTVNAGTQPSFMGETAAEQAVRMIVGPGGRVDVKSGFFQQISGSVLVTGDGSHFDFTGAANPQLVLGDAGDSSPSGPEFRLDYGGKASVAGGVVDLRRGVFTVGRNAVLETNRLVIGPGAVLRGVGNVNPPPGGGSLTVLLEGKISPGLSPGTIGINGGITFGPNSIYDIELAAPTIWDAGTMTGPVGLDGVLRVSVLPGQGLSAGDTFDIIVSTNGISGDFRELVSTDPRYTYTYIITPPVLRGAEQRVRLTVASSPGVCNGDVDGNRSIGANDLSILLLCYGTQLGDIGYIPGADLDGNRFIGANDLTLLLLRFGQSCQ
ncbi:MAG: hypothetical protein IBJ11_10900 [Phycisphaerales bacterium]|nr:hypothetical protein [Phycisphaerales bacterium]